MSVVTAVVAIVRETWVLLAFVALAAAGVTVAAAGVLLLIRDRRARRAGRR